MATETTTPEGPLTGTTVVVTRPRAQAGKLAQSLEELGARVVEFPTIEIRPVADPIEWPDLDSFDWVVFTSANAVRFLRDALQRDGLPMAFPGARVCAVGPATRNAAMTAEIDVDLVPDRFDAEGALEAIERAEENLSGKRVLFPCGAIARDLIPTELRKRGADVHELVVYDTACPEVSDADIDALIAAEPDIVAFTSASTARNYALLLGPERVQKLKGVAYASIGPQTTAAAKKAGLSVAIDAAQRDVSGLVTAIVNWIDEKR